MSTRLSMLFSLSLFCALGLAPATTGQEPSLAQILQKLDGIDAKITGLGDRVTTSETRLNTLDAKVNDIATRLNEFDERQRQILVATSSGDMLDLRSQMQKPPFRNAFDNAVHDVMRDKQGTFTVTNKMSTYQRITVNHADYGLNPGEKITINVSPGNVTTELPGQEQQHWTVSAPHYAEDIDIAPAKQWTTAYRAAETWTPTADPVYTNSYAPLSTTTYYQPPVVTTPVVTSPVVVGYLPVRHWWW